MDTDEVVLEFVTPFAAFVRTHNLEFIEDRFSSPHNIIDPASGLHVSVDQAAALAKEFWHRQSDWQRPVPMAVETLHLLSACCDIILLTAMSREHESARREHLNALSLPY